MSTWRVVLADQNEKPYQYVQGGTYGEALQAARHKCGYFEVVGLDFLW